MHQRLFPAHAGLPALRGPWLDREQALSLKPKLEEKRTALVSLWAFGCELPARQWQDLSVIKYNVLYQLVIILNMRFWMEEK
jgi:hypothetical protein